MVVHLLEKKSAIMVFFYYFILCEIQCSLVVFGYKTPKKFLLKAQSFCLFFFLFECCNRLTCTIAVRENAYINCMVISRHPFSFISFLNRSYSKTSKTIRTRIQNSTMLQRASLEFASMK